MGGGQLEREQTAGGWSLLNFTVWWGICAMYLVDLALQPPIGVLVALKLAGVRTVPRYDFYQLEAAS